MPEYVYVVHYFQSENDDELELQVGERIEVIEKDDEFGDEWWQGRNAAGRVGLFPVNYTAQMPSQNDDVSYPEPEPNFALQTLREEPENESPPIHSPVPKTTSVPSFLDTAEDPGSQEIRPSSHRKSSSDGEMMRATMTDVQKAIEQLGRSGPADDYDDGARSFSFASTKEGGDTETDDTDFDLSDLDGGPQEVDRQDWHKIARRKLAAKAKRALENAKQLEAMMNTSSASTRRTIVPPIEVEISDESEAEEGDYTRTSQLKRTHPGILEEDEYEGEVQEILDIQNQEPASPVTSTQKHPGLTDLDVPPWDETDIPTATADVRSFQVPSQLPIPESITPHERTSEPELESAQAGAEKFVESAAASYPTPASLAPDTEAVVSVANQNMDQKRSSLSQNGLPFPASSSHLVQPAHSNLDKVISNRTSGLPTSEHQLPTHEMPQIELKTSTSEWNVDQVVQWLKSKGFDQGICDKFIEQEITGDVLLELDANVLKTEIGIIAYGKRARIAKAIADLRRPSSFEFPAHPSNSNLPSPVYSTQFPPTLTDSMAPPMHSRMKSQSQQSYHSFPGSGITTHKYSQSMQSSVGSAPGLLPQRQQEQEYEAATLPDQDILESSQQDEATDTNIGLGIDLTSNGQPPASHSPSASGTVLGSSPAATMIPGPSLNDERVDERGHLSEGEVAPTAKTMRRRLFGRSHDSAASGGKSISSKDSLLPSPTVHEADKDSTQGKEKESSRPLGSFGTRKTRKTSESGKYGDRLSIFGGSFGGPLSKHRKPPPSDDASTERLSKFTLPRLQSRKSSASHRSSTPVGSPNGKTAISAGNSPVKERHSISTDASKPSESILRKRTSSAPHPTPEVSQNHDDKGGSVTGTIKQGQNILQQIGEPDHAGWMRKKGERYNIWKTRYFVLQGPHLYCLRSNSNTEKRLKEYINVHGYRVTVDEGIDPGRYGFRIEHDQDKTHFFSSEEKSVVREWMKAFMKATIERDYTKPVMSSCNIPTIPLVVAQAMNPAPRPPSPAARAATQRALLRENPSQLSTRDARVLMGLPGDIKEDRPRADTYFSKNGSQAADTSAKLNVTTTPPSRPSREMRRSNSAHTAKSGIADDLLIEWANSHLPEQHQITDPNGSLCSGLALLRLAESIKGQSAIPLVPDSAFPQDTNDERLDGFVRLFDFLLDNDVKMGSVSINDVRYGKRDKILQVLKGLKSWEEKRKMLSTGIVRPPQPYGTSGFWVV